MKPLWDIKKCKAGTFDLNARLTLTMSFYLVELYFFERGILYISLQLLKSDGVGSIVLGAIQYTGAVFTEIFGGGKARQTSQTSDDLCTEADDDWATLHATSRRNFVLQAISTFFLQRLSSAMVPRLFSRTSWCGCRRKTSCSEKFGRSPRAKVRFVWAPLSHLVGHTGDVIRRLMCG